MSRPHPTGATAPTASQRRSLATIGEVFSRIADGGVTLHLPDGRSRRFGPLDAELDAELTVHDWEFFPRLLHGASVGLGESYVDGQWSCPDLVTLLRVLIANRDVLRPVSVGAFAQVIGDRALHAVRGNRRGQATRNIAAHYDLSNALYERFLDETMTYSSAVFPSPEATLAEAQREKYRRLASRARIAADDHVLEIGCGWGGFAEYAAGELGCRVTGVTLSTEQADYARDRMRRRGLDDRVEIVVIDYRDVAGSYDRVVSIEMLEAVGHRYLPTFFAAVDRLLADDGLAALQVITIPEQRYTNYRLRPDFIQRHVFPGGHLPSLEAMTRAMRRGSQLVVEDVENIAPHYAETLRRWRGRFLANADEVRALGFDDAFVRFWEFYLAYCEAAFRARWVNDLQLTLTRPGNPTLGRGPYAGD